MAQHLSVKVPWKDNRYNSLVCDKQCYNNAWLRLKDISSSRGNELEEKLSGCPRTPIPKSWFIHIKHVITALTSIPERRSWNIICSLCRHDLLVGICRIKETMTISGTLCVNLLLFMTLIENPICRSRQTRFRMQIDWVYSTWYREYPQIGFFYDKAGWSAWARISVFRKLMNSRWFGRRNTWLI